ncbi:MAG: hypothetical protein U0136_05215 [Bdellovibrionota bacterium]
MSRLCHRALCLVLTMLVFSAASRVAWADDAFGPPAPPRETVQPEPAKPAPPKRSATEQVEAAFYQALNLIYSNQFSSASDKFTALVALAGAAGYENLPSYSFVLFERAERLIEQRELEKARFLLKWAEDLSPRDARVSFALATFSDLLGMKHALGSFFHGLRLTMGEPILAGAIGLNVCLVSLVALTLAALVVCLVQIVRNSETIFRSFYAMMPERTRGIVGPIGLLLVLLIPPFGGVLCAVAVWAFLLSRTLGKCRKLAVAAGSLILAWGLAIPTLASGGANINGVLLKAIESLENNSLYPSSQAVLARSLGQPQESPALRFAHAQAAALDANNAEAENEFRQLLKNAAPGSSLETALRLNLAAVAFRQGRIQEAREGLKKLEADGKKSFEIFYNLALVHLAELNTEEHRRYYSLAEELDRNRLTHLESAANEQFLPLLVGAPRGLAFPLLFRLDRANAELGGSVSRQQKLLSSSMFSGMTPQLLVILGVALLLSVLARNAEQTGFSATAVTARTSQVIWHAVPGGCLFADDAPGKGLLILGFFLAFLIAAYEMPLKPFAIVPGERGLTTLFILGAVATFALGAAAAFLHDRGRQTGGEG